MAARLRGARERQLGKSLAGVLDSGFQRALEGDHRDCLQEMVVRGAPVRRQQPRRRQVAKAHASARGRALETFAKARKDTAYGVVLWATPAAGATTPRAGRGAATPSTWGNSGEEDTLIRLEAQKPCPCKKWKLLLLLRIRLVVKDL